MRRHLKLFSRAFFVGLGLAAGGLPGASSGAAADEIAEFYAGKRLIMVVGSASGTGSYDAYARLFSRNIVNHLPGAPSVIVQNKPGAGSLTAIHHVYSVAPQDGTVLLAPNRTAPFTQILGQSSVQFDPEKLNWLGSLYQAIGVLSVTRESPVKSLSDARHTPVIIGSTSPGTDSVIFPALLNNTIDTKLKVIQGYKAKLKVIQGYKGMDNVFLAFLRGEVEGQQSSLEFFQRKIPDWRSKTTILVQFGLNRHPDLPDVPLVFDFLDAKWLAPGITVEEANAFWRFMLTQTTMGHPFAMGPDVPTARVAAMRAAFDAMIKDARFVEEAAKSQLDLLPISGQTIETLVKQAATMPRDLIEKLKTEINYKGENITVPAQQ
jgi:tripartite-type tricarboxylate transporter receptor subunit TctC